MVEIGDKTERATKYALRETGRHLTAIQKERAPVYRSTKPKKGNRKEYVDPRVVPGALRESLHNARDIKDEGPGNYLLKVGPFSQVTIGPEGGRRGPSMYAPPMNRRTGFASSSFADADLPRVMEAALAEAWSVFR